MKNKKVLSIIIIIGLYIVVKLLIINKYNLSSKENESLNKIKEGLIISDLKVINIKKVDNYIEYKNIKIEDIGFECSKDKNTLICNNEDSNLSIEITKSFLEKYNKKIKANSDLDLLGKIKGTTKNDFLKPIPNIIEDYNLEKYALNNLPKVHSIDLIEGDFSGLLFHNSSKKRTLYLYYKNKTYKFVFENINENMIDNLLNSIVID